MPILKIHERKLKESFVLGTVLTNVLLISTCIERLVTVVNPYSIHTIQTLTETGYPFCY